MYINLLIGILIVLLLCIILYLSNELKETIDREKGLWIWFVINQKMSNSSSDDKITVLEEFEKEHYALDTELKLRRNNPRYPFIKEVSKFIKTL